MHAARTRMPAVLLMLTSVACAVRPAAARLAVASADRAASPRSARDAVDPCSGHGSLWIAEVVPTAAAWEHGVTVGFGRVTATVRWCGAEAATLSSLALTPDGRGEPFFVARVDPMRGRLATGAAFTTDLYTSAGPGAYTLTVHALDAHGSEQVAHAQVQMIDHPERAERRAVCAAVGGRWGPQGMMGAELCDRPTRDAGRRCTSDADCEGPCVEAGAEPLVGVPPGAPAVSCGPGERALLVVGRCHDRSLRFGCYPRLTEVAVECITPGRARRARTVCSD